MTGSPSFFIVGAPKAGTTSLNDYLAQYPDIYIPEAKEMHFFGRDLMQKRRKNAALTPYAYLSHFAAMTDEKIAGESSVLYLKSETAAYEIRDFCPEARIIIMLRNPVDLMHALHAQLISQGDEDVEDFSEALALEPERKAGQHLPKGVEVPDDGLLYRETAALGTQLGRYFDVFPAEQIYVIFFEDFASDPQGEVDRVRQFLGLPPGAAPIDTSVRNPSSRPRSRLLTRFLYHPPDWALSLAKRIAPRETLVRLRNRLRRFNDVKSSRTPLPAILRDELSRELEPEIARLERLTGRDLSAWREKSKPAGKQVSVVIPCYNCADTIERAVQSVLEQSYPVAEIILVDDSSTDGTLAILERIAEDTDNVQLVRLNENGGPSRARNAGWDRSTGDWVAFLDSDDAWHPEKIALQLQVARLRPGLSLIGHGCEVSEAEQPWEDFSKLDDEAFSKLHRPIGKWRLMLSNPWPTPSVMLRRDIPQRFDVDLSRAEDYLLWLRIVMAGGMGIRIDLDLARLFKAKYGAGGLSADLRASEVGELSAIHRLRCDGLISGPVALAWSAFSVAKYFRRVLSRK